jgi:hypothetical protein
MGKVKELTQRFKDQNIDWDLLICGDTILELDNVIIEKPVKNVLIRKIKSIAIRW